MAIEIKITGYSSTPIWNELQKMNFSNKSAAEWYVTRYSYDEYITLKEKIEALPETILVFADGPLLVGFQKEFVGRGMQENTPIGDNLLHNRMVIGRLVEEKVQDDAEETSADEPSTSSSSDQPQS